MAYDEHYDADGNLFNQLTSVGNEYSTFVYYGDATSNNSGSFRFYDPLHSNTAPELIQGAGVRVMTRPEIMAASRRFLPVSSRRSITSTDQINYRKGDYQETGETSATAAPGARERPDKLHLDIDNNLVAYQDTQKGQ